MKQLKSIDEINKLQPKINRVEQFPSNDYGNEYLVFISDDYFFIIDIEFGWECCDYDFVISDHDFTNHMSPSQALKFGIITESEYKRRIELIEIKKQREVALREQNERKQLAILKAKYEKV